MIKSNRLFIGYILVFIYHSWFWLGTWMLYYLKFGTYSQIGLLEAVMMTTAFLSEVPTGAIADLLGKQKTLFIAFTLSSLANILMGAATNILGLSISLFFFAIGNSFYSGTMEAWFFDYLKERREEQKFDQVISKSNTLGLAASAGAALVGGFLYALNPRLPYFIVGLIYVWAAILCLFLPEPRIDSIKFSWKNYWLQNKIGFNQLFKNIFDRERTILLLITGATSVLAYEILIDALAVEFGFKGQQLGILIMMSFLVSAVASQLTPWLLKRFSSSSLVFVSAFGCAIVGIIASQVTFIAGAVVILVWAAFNTTYGNVASVVVNNQTESKYRATTISTFTLLKSVPYVLSAYFIGRLMETYTARGFAGGLGIIFSGVLILTVLWWNILKKNEQNLD